MVNSLDMNVIKYPIITDKATRLLANNQYSFIVSPKSDKPTIKAAIEYLGNDSSKLNQHQNIIGDKS